MAVLHALPLVLPVTGTTDLCILNVLSLYPNCLIVGLSFLLPRLLCRPKCSSITSWHNFSVKTNSIPSRSKHLIILIIECTVMARPSNVRFQMNILACAFALKVPGRFLILVCKSLRYLRNKFSNQLNLSSSGCMAMRSCFFLFYLLLCI